MKRDRHISNQVYKMILGLFTGFVVLTSTIWAEKPTEQTEMDQSDAEKENISISPAVPHSTLQVNPGFQSYLLEEVVYREDEKKGKSVFDLIGFRIHKTIHALLHRIIVPNAP